MSAPARDVLASSAPAASRSGAGEPLVLHEDRFFSAEPTQRRIARALYEETRGLPLVCPHGHVEPALLAENAPFPEPTALLLIPDHYIFRMLYSQGVPLEDLGIPTRDGTPVEGDPRRIWQRFAEHWHLFRGTPTRAWLDHELHEVFGVRTKLSGDTAQAIYDEIAERLQSPEYRPRALFERFNIELLATTDAASDSLEHHRTIRESGWKGRVIPTFRPDAVLRIAAPTWRDALAAFERVHGAPIGDQAAFVDALATRRAFFKAMGATATDHAVVEPYTAALRPEEADALFQRARAGEATPADQRRYEAHMLLEMARLSTEDGLVMQLHPGAFRDHNGVVAARFGADKGADIPVATEYTRNLQALLETYGNDPRFTMVLFTLDESTYARELAPLAGHYPALRLGPAWWFHDSLEGMTRYRERVTETAGIYNTAGFNDDTRAFCSIPARHDLSRRVDANWLAGLVARHVIDMDDARPMARALAYDLVRRTYKLDADA
ncbi:uronate isomerase [Roseisolibacter agri]|uniref:Uronate isomerase n=1 Tax=Roseisolibacter agri TaxID=2014610 RepID=A0AA37Q4R3_9BACT|nr:glucuronate isomerase [Roseisolibacter agri]GLC23747.1 uronate isomerase [Roseisolibacter agri]